MKKILFAFIYIIALTGCNGRTKAEQKNYEDSLFHVISCSGEYPYTTDEKLEALDLLEKEHPDKHDKFEKIRIDMEKLRDE